MSPAFRFMIFCSLLSAGWASLSPAGRADVTYVDARELGKRCASADHGNLSWCDGFISAEVEIMAHAPLDGLSACLPRRAKLPDLLGAVQQWLAEHPEAGPQSASFVVARALAETFPCPHGEIIQNDMPHPAPGR